MALKAGMGDEVIERRNWHGHCFPIDQYELQACVLLPNNSPLAMKISDLHKIQMDWHRLFGKTLCSYWLHRLPTTSVCLRSKLANRVEHPTPSMLKSIWFEQLDPWLTVLVFQRTVSWSQQITGFNEKLILGKTLQIVHFNKRVFKHARWLPFTEVVMGQINRIWYVSIKQTKLLSMSAIISVFELQLKASFAQTVHIHVFNTLWFGVANFQREIACIGQNRIRQNALIEAVIFVWCVSNA